MKITEIIKEPTITNQEIDYVELEWWELSKRIQRKRTCGGRDIAMKFMSESIAMKSGDVLYVADNYAVKVRVLTTPTIVLSPKTMHEMATICYEIGNKHMPLFIDGDDILLPYEAPMYKWLQSAGYTPKQEDRLLENRLKSNGSHHHHSHDGSILERVKSFATRN